MTPEIKQSLRGRSGHCSSLVGLSQRLVITKCKLVGLAFTACPSTFMSDHVQNYPDPKSGWDLDPDKLGSITTCWEVKLTDIFTNTLMLFS